MRLPLSRVCGLFGLSFALLSFAACDCHSNRSCAPPADEAAATASACCTEGEGGPCCSESAAQAKADCSACAEAKKDCAACPASKAELLATAEPDEKGAKVPPALNFKMETLDGKQVELAKYSGKVVMFVNVASKCGLTPQYKGLQALHDKYAYQGLVIVGIPANDFGKQEPGTNSEIGEFCKSNYGVKFDMLGKVVVKGEGQCPLYQFLTSKETNPNFAGPIGWNFEKFVIARNGEVVGRFAPRVAPDAAEFVKLLETELAKK